MRKHFIVHYYEISDSMRQPVVEARMKMDRIYNSAKQTKLLDGQSLAELVLNSDIQQVLQSADFFSPLSSEQKNLHRLMLDVPNIQSSGNTDYYKQLASICLGLDHEEHIQAQTKIAKVTKKLYRPIDVFVLGRIAPPYVAAFIQKGDETIFSGAYREMCVQAAADVAKQIGATVTILEEASVPYNRSPSVVFRVLQS